MAQSRYFTGVISDESFSALSARLADCSSGAGISEGEFSCVFRFSRAYALGSVHVFLS